MDWDEFRTHFEPYCNRVSLSIVINAAFRLWQSVQDYRRSAEHGESYHDQRKMLKLLALSAVRLDRAVESFSENYIDSDSQSFRDLIRCIIDNHCNTDIVISSARKIVFLAVFLFFCGENSVLDSIIENKV